MSMSKQPSWDTLFANLSLSDPRCNNDSCQAFYNAHQLSQKEVSYYYQYEYGHFVTWYYLVVIGILSASYGFSIIRHRKEKTLTEHEPRKMLALRNYGQAAYRYVGYRRIRGRLSDKISFPSLGMLCFLLLATLYLCILTFAVRPYYRQHRGYGSPPLAVRTGLMAIALTPLLIALSGKANIVTVLTGIGHEKLNIVHRWVGWMCLGLSVVHTVPFIVAPLHDGGYPALHKQFYKPGAFECTGVPPLAMLFGLVLFSLPWFRHRVYEVFYSSHFLLAVSYVGLMFWHAGHEGDSWNYLWAAIGIWLASILARAFWFNQATNVTQNDWMLGAPVILRELPENMTKVEILAPPNFHWRPGQHCFLRFPDISMLDSHPFTIASTDFDEAKTSGSEFKSRIISFYVRSFAGFTKRLARYLKSHPDASIHAWIDGPYGGYPGLAENCFDNIILVAGGGGISACLPWFEFLAKRMALPRNESRLALSDFKLIWSVREKVSAGWISEELGRLEAMKLGKKKDITIHVTGNDWESVQPAAFHPNVKGSEGKTQPAADFPEIMLTTLKNGSKLPSLRRSTSCDEEGLQKLDTGMFRKGRLSMDSVLAGLNSGSRTLVLACGPESLKIDVSNACARAQRKVFVGDVREIALWTETFGW